MPCSKTQPPWEFLLSASRNSLQSYELSRLSHAANLRKEIGALLDQWLEENACAMAARWLIEQQERPLRGPEAEGAEQLLPNVKSSQGVEAVAEAGPPIKSRRVVSDNFFADRDGARPIHRSSA